MTTGLAVLLLHLETRRPRGTWLESRACGHPAARASRPTTKPNGSTAAACAGATCRRRARRRPTPRRSLRPTRSGVSSRLRCRGVGHFRLDQRHPHRPTRLRNQRASTPWAGNAPRPVRPGTCAISQTETKRSPAILPDRRFFGRACALLEKRFSNTPMARTAVARSTREGPQRTSWHASVGTWPISFVAPVRQTDLRTAPSEHRCKVALQAHVVDDLGGRRLRPPGPGAPLAAGGVVRLHVAQHRPCGQPRE